jgi:hypothetical protein
MTDLRLRLDAADARPDSAASQVGAEQRPPMDFERLVELGRSLIPKPAPGWTDHNVHDPGIMLVELLAWVADAQIYSLARMRRDERLAYSRVMGVEASGPVPAAGLLWPDEGATPWPDGHVVEMHNEVTADHPEAPPFFVTHPILLASPVQTIVSSVIGGTSHDWTSINRRDGATFEPFGASPLPGDHLQLTLVGRPLETVTRSRDPRARADAKTADALFSIGFEVVRPDSGPALPTAMPSASTNAGRPRLRVTMQDSLGERPLEVVVDTTEGLLRSGVLLLRGVATSDKRFSFRIRSADRSGAFLRPPRLQRVSVNVLPIRQRETVFEQADFIGDLPDQTYQLGHPGPEFPGADANAGVSVTELGEDGKSWTITRSLGECGPDQRVFELDRTSRTLLFGNGINGRIPSSITPLTVSYTGTRGPRGNLPAGLTWTIRGIAGVFGRNSEPTAGGSPATTLEALRSRARTRSRRAHPIVTTSDLREAALAFKDLGVRRALELTNDFRSRRLQGFRELIVVGPHDSTPAFNETEYWLTEVRRRLSPRLPVGQRLEVRGPHYTEVRVMAGLVVAPGFDPNSVHSAANATLRERFAIVPRRASDPAWPFGRDVTLPAVKGWLRRVEGVAHVTSVRLLANGVDTEGQPVTLGNGDLPRFLSEPGDIVVSRPDRGLSP